MLSFKIIGLKTCLIKKFNQSEMDERTDEQTDEQRVATQIGHKFDILCEVLLRSDINFTKLIQNYLDLKL